MNRTEKLKRFQKALDLFLERVRKDPNLLAAVLVGSLTEKTIWRKDAICLWLIEKDGVAKRLRADGEDPRVFRTLVEEGVNLHVELIPRSRFKRMVEGSAGSANIASTGIKAPVTGTTPRIRLISLKDTRCPLDAP